MGFVVTQWLCVTPVAYLCVLLLQLFPRKKEKLYLSFLLFLFAVVFIKGRNVSKQTARVGLSARCSTFPPWCCHVSHVATCSTMLMKAAVHNEETINRISNLDFRQVLYLWTWVGYTLSFFGMEKNDWKPSLTTLQRFRVGFRVGLQFSCRQTKAKKSSTQRCTMYLHLLIACLKSFKSSKLAVVH